MEKPMEKFAEAFKPVFSASTIVTFLGKPGIKTKVDFLKKFEPFSDYKIAAQTKNPNPILLSQDEKDSIKKLMKDTFSSDCLKFDDTSLVQMFNDDIGLISAKMEQVNLQSEFDDIAYGTNETKFTGNMEELKKNQDSSSKSVINLIFVRISSKFIFKHALF